ncbi:STAS domain-containing protein [Streptomyces sp. NPDC005899]|uniref:STAS domain-containing protein n=1 Tax=Streptomyces sp. NPDC005899 TaxID=3155716 RepID=UPI0033D4A7E7
MDQASQPVARVVARPGGDGTRIIVCTGELDVNGEPLLRQALDTALRDGVARTVVDLSGVSFADSSMLNTLVRAHTRQHMILAGPLTRQVARLLQVSGTDQLFTIAADGAVPTDRPTRTS